MGTQRLRVTRSDGLADPSHEFDESAGVNFSHDGEWLTVTVEVDDTEKRKTSEEGPGLTFTKMVFIATVFRGSATCELIENESDDG